VRPLRIIYLARVALAIVAAALSTAVTLAIGEQDYRTFLNGVTIALLVYLITYYIFKAKFRAQVEKQSKIMSMGIGIYFFTWLVAWILMYTITLGQT
jgi:hypothetical protein